VPLEKCFRPPLRVEQRGTIGRVALPGFAGIVVRVMRAA
jgi:hypothetical protein